LWPPSFLPPKQTVGFTENYRTSSANCLIQRGFLFHEKGSKSHLHRYFYRRISMFFSEQKHPYTQQRARTAIVALGKSGPFLRSL
jgi:hypothetical protein